MRAVQAPGGRAACFEASFANEQHAVEEGLNLATESTSSLVNLFLQPVKSPPD